MHSHGSPYDRGSADRYYGRPFAPHCYISTAAGAFIRLEQDLMTEQQVAEYVAGWDEEYDRKDWR